MTRNTIAVIVMIVVMGSIHNIFLSLFCGMFAYMAITFKNLVE